MLDLMGIKTCIDQLREKNRSKEDVKRYLSSSDQFNDPSKKIIFDDLFPPIIPDKELPTLIVKNREAEGKKPLFNFSGFLVPVESEIAILYSAFKSEQYQRFMLHLLHSFTSDKKVYPIGGRFKSNCALCNKVLYNYDIWYEECLKFPQLAEKEKERKEFLSFGSNTSNLNLCLDCIVQLKALKSIVEYLNNNIKF